MRIPQLKRKAAPSRKARRATEPATQPATQPAAEPEPDEAALGADTGMQPPLTPAVPAAPRRGRLRQLLRLYEVNDEQVFTSTRQAEPLNPALIGTHPQMAGSLAGVEVETGQPVSCSPHALYEQKRITSPNIIVLGDIGRGKSSFIKTTYVLREIACGTQVAVLDRKNQQGVGEYDRVCEAAAGTTVRFSRAGGAAINLLDPRIAAMSHDYHDAADARVGQDHLLQLAAEFAHGALTSRAAYALRAAHRAALARAADAGRVATIHDVIDALFTPDTSAIPHEALAATGAVRLEDLRSWGLDVAMDLQRFIDGDLSGLVDAHTSSDIDWNAGLLVFDTSELEEGSAALALVMSLIATFLSAVWSATPGRRIIAMEEGYTADRLGAGSMSVARILRALVKRGRGIGLAFVTAFHHISDVDPSSDLMTLIREAEVAHIYRQAWESDRQAVIREIGLPAWSDSLLGRLDTGVQIMKIGTEPARQIRHLLTSIETDLVDTDQGMVAHE